jgi:hypothetical protein
VRTSWQRIIVLSTFFAIAGCTSLSTVRLQPEAIEVAPNLRPIAGIQANAISGYILFIPIPGVDLDKVVNQMLVVAAKTMGADKVAQLQFDMTPDGGVWTLRKLIGWRSAQATGIAVQVTALPPDPTADEGPEPGHSGPPATPSATVPSPAPSNTPQ